MRSSTGPLAQRAGGGEAGKASQLSQAWTPIGRNPHPSPSRKKPITMGFYPMDDGLISSSILRMALFASFTLRMNVL